MPEHRALEVLITWPPNSFAKGSILESHMSTIGAFPRPCRIWLRDTSQLMFGILPLARAQVADGKVRALAVLSTRREAAIPEVPTMAKQRISGIEGGPWFGLMAPAGTPRQIIEWLNAEATRAFTSTELKSKLEAQGLVLPLGSPQDFAAHIALAETARSG